MAEQIVIDFRAEVDAILKQIDQLKNKIGDVGEAEKKQAKDADTANKSLVSATRTRKQLLDQEIAELNKLEAAKKKAFSVKEIDQYNKSIAQTQKNISVLKNEVGTIQGINKQLIGSFTQVAGALGLAFSAQAVIQFANESVQAFREAEVTANRLEFAVTKIGKEGSAAFELLIQQSNRLQEISIFSDDDIQKAQTQLIQFGLTSREVENLIPKILDLASATGTDLAQATDLVIQGINGQTRALKPLGLEFKNTGDKAENLNIITEKLIKFQGSTAQALETSAGQAANLTNKIDELKENLGRSIDTSGFVNSIKNAFGGLVDFVSDNSDIIVDALTRMAANIVPGGIALIDLFRDTNEELRKQLEETNKQQINIFSQASFDEQKTLINKASDEIKKLSKVLQDNAKAEEKLSNEQLASIGLRIAANQQLIKSYQELAQARITPSNLGLTDDEKAKREAEAIKIRQKAQEDFLKAEEAIRKLRLSLIDDEEQKIIASAEEQKKQVIGNEQQKAQQILLINQKLLNDLIALDKKRNDAANELAIQDINRQVNIDSEQGSADLKIRLTAEENAQKKLNDIRLQGFREGSIGFINEKIKILQEQQAAELADVDKSIANEQEALNEKFKINEKYNEQIANLTNQLTQQQVNQLTEYANIAGTVFGLITDLSNMATQTQIENLILLGEEQQAAYDAEVAALDDQRNKKIIGELAYEARLKQINESRKKSEQQTQEAIRKEKTKTAQSEKLLKLFEIGLELALAIAQRDLVKIAAAASQLVLVASTPIPKFKKGVVDYKGEGGPEDDKNHVMISSGESIITAKGTKNNKELLKAINKNFTSEFINLNYVVPALEKQKREYEKAQQQQIAKHITNSVIHQTIGGDAGMDEAMLRRVFKDGIKIKNTRDIAKAMNENKYTPSAYR